MNHVLRALVTIAVLCRSAASVSILRVVGAVLVVAFLFLSVAHKHKSSACVRFTVHVGTLTILSAARILVLCIVCTFSRTTIIKAINAVYVFSIWSETVAFGADKVIRC